MGCSTPVTVSGRTNGMTTGTVPIAHETVDHLNHHVPLLHPEISIRSACNADRYSTA